MATKKISELTAKTAATGVEEFVINDGGTSKKITRDDLLKNVTLPGAEVTGNLSLGDNVKAQFGAGNDLQIYSDGSNSIVKETGSGQLRLQGNDLYLMNEDGSSLYLAGVNGAQTQIYHNAAVKLATTSTGIDVAGSVTCDGLIVSGTENTVLYGNSTDATALIALADNGGSVNIINSSGDLRFKVGGSANTSGIGSAEAMRIDSVGNVGIGTTSPSSYDSDADDLVVATSGNTGITIKTSSTGKGSVFFADGTTGSERYQGIIKYDHSDNSMLLATAGSERMRIDSDGNVGIGTVPKTWHSSSTALEVGSTSLEDYVTGGANVTNLTNNTYRATDNNHKYKETDYASGYTQYNGVHSFNVAPSGTVDTDVTWTKAMSITNDAKVGIGTISPSSKLEVAGTVNTYGNGSVALQWGDTSALGALSFDGSANPVIRSASAKPLVFQTNGANEAMRIDSNGNVGVGVVPKSWNSDLKALQMNNTAVLAGSSDALYLANNWYRNSAGADTYLTNDYAAFYRMSTVGTHEFKVAPSGTADTAISWTTAMSIANNGNVGIGATDPLAKLEIRESGLSTPAVIRLIGTNNVSSTSNVSHISSEESPTGGAGAADTVFSNRSVGDPFASPTEKMRILAGGGITFNGDTAAANALDDYEEGGFTADFNDDTGSVIASTAGYYTKVGKIVKCVMQIYVNSVTAGNFSGIPYINMPFPVHNSASMGFYPIYMNGIGTINSGYILGGTQKLILTNNRDEPFGNTATNSAYGGSVRLYGEFTYMTS